MTRYLTTAQIRALESAAIASGAETGETLMERAGGAVARTALETWPEARRVVVLAGPGNNGGDGYVVARRLAGAGRSVNVHALDLPGSSSPDACAAAKRWRTLGGETLPLATLPDAEAPDLIVDALFGAGIRRPVSEKTLAPLDNLATRAGRPPTLAVDGPSGLCLDSGRPRGRVVPADLTVTFHALRRGHVLGEGPVWSGTTRAVDIGLAPFEAALTREVLQGAEPRPEVLLKSEGHKYRYGHAFILAGPAGRGGAARLAAAGALRAGAGLVTLVAPPDAIAENAARLDAIMLREAADAEALRALLADRRVTAVALGPGLGAGDATREAALAAVEDAAETGRGVVLDADALTSLAEDGAARAEIFARFRGARVVLTPHEGEFARLFPHIAAELRDEARTPLASRADLAAAAAAESGATMLLKGPDTIVASPEGSLRVNAAVGADAAPWLATAGAGDVLAGVVAGLLARGLPAPDAATQAAWLHAEAARRVGPGLTAEDLPGALPAVLSALVP